MTARKRADPFLQLTLDAKKAIPLVARAVGLSPGDIYVGLFDLWERAWVTKRIYVTLLEIQGCFGSNPNVIEALVTFGFLARPDADLLPSEYRIRGGMERLLGVHKAQSDAGKTNSGNLAQNKPETGGEPVQIDSTGTGYGPKTGGEPDESRPAMDRLLHPTPSIPDASVQSTTPSASSTGELALAKTVLRERGERRLNPKATPPHPRSKETQVALEQAFLEATGEPYRWQGGKDGAALKAMLRTELPDKIVERWKTSITLKKFPGTKSVAAMAFRWSEFAETRPRAGVSDHGYRNTGTITATEGFEGL